MKRLNLRCRSTLVAVLVFFAISLLTIIGLYGSTASVKEPEQPETRDLRLLNINGELLSKIAFRFYGS